LAKPKPIRNIFDLYAFVNANFHSTEHSQVQKYFSLD
jgi:hypothetical protein